MATKTNKTEIFIDAIAGHLWFKSNKTLWLDHPDAKLALRARIDCDGLPQLAGHNLSGKLIGEEKNDKIDNAVVDAIVNLRLPDYLKSRLEQTWSSLKAEVAG